MRFIAEVKERLRALLFSAREDRELEEEFRFHLDKETDSQLARGVSVEQARRRARVAFGGTDRMKEEVIDARGVRPLADLGRDVRYALRTLRRSPGFTTVAMLTLALGIGANTAIFSVLNAVLLRPLPTPGLDRLVVMEADVPSLNVLKTAFAPLEVFHLAAREDLFEAMTGFRSGDRTLTGHGEPVRITTAATLGDFRGVFAPRLHAGTFYRPEQSVEGPREVAVLSYGLWQQLSGGDASFIGSTIELDGITHEVVGVLDREFRYPNGVQVWVPFALTEHQANRGSWIMTTVARVRPGIGPERLAGRLDIEAARWKEQFFEGQTLRANRFIEYHAGQLGPIVLVLMGAVIFVLLIAAANVGSLHLVRASGRGREIAVRGALGAGQFRIARQLLVESSLLACAGGVAGLLVAAGTLRAFERWLPAQQMHLADIPLDGTVLGFTATVVVLVATAFGTVPAVRAARMQPQQVLRESVRSSTAGIGRHRLLQASVVTQVALALVLLLGAGLMIRTLFGLFAANPGFHAENVVTAQISVPPSAYPESERRLAFFDEVLARARAIPGVEHAALIYGLPFADQIDSSPFEIPSRPQQPDDPQRHHEARIISGDYFRTMRIPLLAGRSFDDTERPPSEMSGDASLVAVIDETFADQFFPGENPVGQVFATGYFGMTPATIIGVVARVDQREVGGAPKASAYYSYRYARSQPRRSIVMRSTRPVANVVDALRAVVKDMDPNVPLYDVQPMRARIEQSFGPRRMAMLALGVFAGLSLLLAMLGVYAVMRYTTNERTREIGICMALGAAGGDVVRSILRDAAAVILAGIAIGVAAALIAARAMEAILFGVTASDPLTLVASAAVLGVVALVACYLPAQRATRVDPMIVLRAE